MHSKAANTLTLLKLDLRRDWLKILAWWIGLAGLMGGAAAKFDGIYGTKAALTAIIQTLKTPAMVALLGPFTAKPPYVTVVIYSTEMMVFMGLFQAMMGIYFAIHSTRSEEDDGSVELVLARAVGRQSPMLAAVAELIIVNLGAGVLEALGLQFSGLQGITTSGNWLFGLGLATFGFMFGAIALVAAQAASSARSATMWSYVILGVLFVARMGTDIQHPEATWWTIFGWIEKLGIYMTDNWWPISLMLILGLVGVGGSVALAASRDIGAGLFAIRDGRKRASFWLAGPFTLIARLERISALIWLLGLALLGASYGSIFGNIGNLMSSNPTVAKILGGSAVRQANRAAVLATAGKLTIIFAVVASIPAILTLFRLNVDEKKGYWEMLHATAVSRLRLYVALSTQAIVVSTLALLLAVGGMSLAGQAVMSDSISLTRFMRGFVGYWPAVFTVLGLSAALAGMLPKLQGLAWLLPLYGIFSLYLGPLVNLPQWARNLTPYGWINDVPMRAIQWSNCAWMSALGLGLFALGYAAYRRRDLLVN